MNSNKKKAAFYTLGCKVNQYETESLKKEILALGYEETSFEEKANIYIINSCTVTKIADRKTRNILRRSKKINPNSIVIVTGCYAQTNVKELEEIKEIDYIIGNTEKNVIIDIVRELKEEKPLEKEMKERVEELKNINIFSRDTYEDMSFSTLRENTRAYVKIQDGCNNFCSYCKIPFARGKSKSRQLESILEEAKELASKGYKELILIGINLGEYGPDLDSNLTLETLLLELEKIDGIKRIRLGSVYPDRLTEEFIKVYKKSGKLMPHLHISLQSCSDNVLKGMKRNYTSELIRERLINIKKEIKDMEYTADIIVGFPGESEEDFKDTMKLVEEIGFQTLHIFQYSDRENTVASKMSGKIESKDKKDRAERLGALSKKMGEEIKKKYKGKIVEVLLEKNEEYFEGYTENYIRVQGKGTKDKKEENKIIKVKLTGENLKGKWNILEGVKVDEKK